jgi:NAD(P)-dependent dehydrogenase (short-subunit alcohol dehydrogenase family)
MPQRYADAVAVVTGAGAGIGRALAEALSAHGSRVILADIDFDAVEAAASRIRASGGAATAARVDVADARNVSRLFDQTIANEGRIDYLFNNAGINVVGEAIHLTLEDWQRLVAVNLMGVVHGVLAAYPLMIRQNSGHIINVASMAGILPAPFQVGYAATKHAVVGLSLSLRAEASKYGVGVSVVCPGWVDTRMKDTQRVVGVDRDRVIAAVPFRYYPANLCARDILRGVARNRSMIMITRFPRWAHRVHRWLPWLVERVSANVARRGL